MFQSYFKMQLTAVILLMLTGFPLTAASGQATEAFIDPQATAIELPRDLTAADWQSIHGQITHGRSGFTKTVGAQPTYVKASNTNPEDEFGWSVAISGDTVVVGARYENSAAEEIDGDQGDNSASDAGAAYVFVREGTTWIQQAYLKPFNTDPNDRFGFSVAIDGDLIVVGAPGEDSNGAGFDHNPWNNSFGNSGAAYVFFRSGTIWSQEAYLKPVVVDYGDNFGTSVAISGDTIVVGALYEASNATGVDGDAHNNQLPYAGAAYVFVRSGSFWGQEAYLKAFNTQNGDRFGEAVAISNDTIVVGASQESGNARGVNGPDNNLALHAGAAYVFARVGGQWSQEAYLKASNSASNNFFGSSVAVADDTVVIGAYQESSPSSGVDSSQAQPTNALWVGAAYVFVRSSGSWSQQAYLKASNAEQNDRFGKSVAITGNIIVVGADQESSPATGVNGTQGNATGTAGSGAAYIFLREGETWSQTAYLKASNTGLRDAFGTSVGVSGNGVVVGAHLEESPVTGINGDPGDDTTLGGDSGAAYIFELPNE